jgi:alpha-L-fucosidase 2
VPLTGEGLTQAHGENPNPFFARPDIAQPRFSKELSAPQHPLLYNVYEYDLSTEAGKHYLLKRQ